MFRFALQPLLDRRQCEFEVAQARAATAVRRLSQAERSRADLERRLRSGAPSTGELQAIALLLDGQQRGIAAAKEARDAGRRELAAASSGLCVVNSLRRSALAAYRDAQRRREEAEIDESNACRRTALSRGYW